ncbi:MAG: glycosyltransferase family 4 protein [Acidobacteria bacterium]|nr:glycosyltransferase family 4 protein [Acidobacteriota bacterium]
MTLRVLWGSPLPPVRSGVSDYAAELLPELARLARIRALRPPQWDGDLAAPGVELVGTDTSPCEGEITLLHLGNNPFHLWLLEHIENAPRVIVLHDLVLHHLLVEATLAKGDREGYRTRMVSAYGAAGEALARGRALGFEAMRDPFLFPVRAPFLAGAAAAVVHSKWAERQVVHEFPAMPVLRLAMPAHDPGPGIDRARIRRRLGVKDGELLVMHLGFLTPAKGLEAVLAAVSAATRMGSAVRLVLVGEGRAAEGVQQAARIGDRVSATGWVPYETFLSLPAAADLGVVLRSPSAGETSAAVVRFLACGTPVVVGGLHQFLEWPQSAVARVTPGPGRPAELARVLVRAFEELQSGDAARRRKAARTAYMAGGHRPRDVAQKLAGFLGGLAL